MVKSRWSKSAPRMSERMSTPRPSGKGIVVMRILNVRPQGRTRETEIWVMADYDAIMRALRMRDTLGGYGEWVGHPALVGYSHEAQCDVYEVRVCDPLSRDEMAEIGWDALRTWKAVHLSTLPVDEWEDLDEEEWDAHQCWIESYASRAYDTWQRHL